ncbi:predicted protein [Uncinocarpus reesii 1704]|uniref:Myb-like domain-containing protein n=1 Tax=Uncinocarpus reesii (strain UAMH 1704) TaxID=336963 RepID=C4JWD6_UNCRE|nr:uncharacterized protein UREG_06878 [Uncinocarpus reesii 1704]EEP82013.1 predicted protein [Uncinocarpus reesii 1704]
MPATKKPASKPAKEKNPPKKPTKWTEEERIFLAAMRLATNWSWEEIRGEHEKAFEGRGRTAKDLESQYNKALKPKLDRAKGDRTFADALDDYRHYGKATHPDDQRVIDQALEFLERLDKKDRLW